MDSLANRCVRVCVWRLGSFAHAFDPDIRRRRRRRRRREEEEATRARARAHARAHTRARVQPAPSVAIVAPEPFCEKREKDYLQYRTT